MTTNFKKLVGWNLEEYNDMSDEGCLVCLTERERYLLGQMTRQITWLTRWDNPESGVLPDLYEIQGKLDYKMSIQGCIDLCQEILVCIENTEGIQEAIAFYGGGSNINANSGENDSNLAGQLVNDPVGCDNDIIFGMTVQLVEFADRLIKDLFEQLSAAQLASVNVGYLIKLVPVLETLPIDEAFELTDKLVQDMETAYLSASTQLLKDEIACDLLCLAQDNDCILTLEMVRDYYQEKAEIVFSYDSVFLFMSDFINGTFVGNAVYYGMNIFFFQIFVFGGKFLEYFFEDYLRTINAMYNDPNSDWDTLCDECEGTWEYEIDFTVSSGTSDGWGQNLTWGNGWVDGSGWSSETAGGDSELDYLQCVLPEVSDVTYIEFAFAPTTEFTEFTGGFITAGYTNVSYSELFRITASGLVQRDQVMYDGAPVTCDSISTRNNPSTQSGDVWYITGAKLRGRGDNPFS